MEEVTITLPKPIAASLLEFINANMQVQGKEGANALLLIVSAFEASLVVEEEIEFSPDEAL